MHQFLKDCVLHFIIINCSAVLCRKLPNICIVSPHVFSGSFELLQPFRQCENFLENLGKLSGGQQRKIVSKWRERNGSLNCKIKALF